MKELIRRHQEAIEKHTPLDYNRLQNITYLFEFDREIQYVNPRLQVLQRGY